MRGGGISSFFRFWTLLTQSFLGLATPGGPHLFLRVLFRMVVVLSRYSFGGFLLLARRGLTGGLCYGVTFFFFPCRKLRAGDSSAEGLTLRAPCDLSVR